MFGFGKEKFNVSSPAEEEKNLKEQEKTPKRLINFGKGNIELFCKNFEVEGLEQLDEFLKEHEDEKMIVTASHMNNLDVPAVLKVLGPKLNLQVVGSELHSEKAKYIVQNLGEKLLFQDNFTKVGQKEENGVESGVFRLENFQEFDKSLEEGRTPWIAAHSFSKQGVMRKVDNGALVEAYRQGTWIIPTAMEVSGGSKSLEGAAEIAQNATKKSDAIYHIGEPYKPEPLPEGLDIHVIDEVLLERQNGKSASEISGFEDFKKIIAFLSEQSEELGRKISSMLPEEQRGYYQDKKQEEKSEEIDEEKISA